jgi:hypothetical protein
METATSLPPVLSERIRPTYSIDLGKLEFDLVTRCASFEVIAHTFEELRTREARKICIQALERRPLVQLLQAEWFEQAIMKLAFSGDADTAGSLLRAYRGHYEREDPSLSERSLGFVCSERVRRLLPPRVIVRAIRAHLSGYDGTETYRTIYRKLNVREALVWVLEAPEKKHPAYSDEDWQNAEIVFWCAVHMADEEMIPHFEAHLRKMGTYVRGGSIWPSGGGCFLVERNRAILERVIRMLKHRIPAESSDLSPSDYKKRYGEEKPR